MKKQDGIKHGFSLMEMMIVLLIVSIIAAASAPMVSKKLGQSTLGRNDSICFWQDAGTKGIRYNTGGSSDAVVGIGSSSVESSRLYIHSNSTSIPQIALGGSSGDSMLISADNNSVSISDTVSSSANSVTIGHGAKTSKTYSVAIGYGANASGYNSTALGRNANASGYNSTALGRNANASSVYSTALGYYANSAGSPSTALGSNATASSAYSTALGYKAMSSGDNSIAIGSNASATSLYSLAIGADSKYYDPLTNLMQTRAESERATAIGCGSHAANVGTTAVGCTASAGALNPGQYATAIGSNSTAGGMGSVAIGADANTSGFGSIVIGGPCSYNGYSYNAAEAKHSMAIAIGSGTEVNTFSVAIGTGAKAAYQDSVAIGTGAKAAYQDSVAIGFNAETLANNQIVLGTKYDTVYIPGNFVVGNSVLLNVGSNDARTGMRLEGYNSTYVYGIEGDTVNTESGVLKRYSKWNKYASSTNGMIDYVIPCDKRLKDIGESFVSGLESIKKLEVFNYTFKDDKKKTPRVGVIAQDLKKIFPEAVFKGEDGFYRIRTEDIFYALVNAVKELDERVAAIEKRLNVIEAQNQKITALEAQNKKLEERIAELEKVK